MEAYSIDFDVEIQNVRSLAEDIFKNGGVFLPMTAAYNKKELRYVITMRDTTDHDMDKRNAFAEMCTLMPFAHISAAVIAWDAPVKVNDEEYPAINVMMVMHESAMSQALTYEVDEDAQFDGWIDLDEENHKARVNYRALSKNMPASLAKFMAAHRHLSNFQAMVDSLTSAGHKIHIPEGALEKIVPEC